VGVDPALLIPNTIAFSDGSPYGDFVTILYLREEESSAGAQCPAAPLAFVLPRGDPLGCYAYSSTISRQFFFLYSWQKAIFILLNLTCRCRMKKSLFAQGRRCILI